MPARLQRVRTGPGETVCPTCRHLTANADLVEIVHFGKKKGKRVCTGCGLAYLRARNTDLRPHKGPVQTDRQQSII